MAEDNIDDLGLSAKEQDQITSTAVAFDGDSIKLVTLISL